MKPDSEETQTPDRTILDRCAGLTFQLAAAHLQYSARHVRRLIREGKLETKGHGQYKTITTKSIAEFIGYEKQRT